MNSFTLFLPSKLTISINCSKNKKGKIKKFIRIKSKQAKDKLLKIKPIFKKIYSKIKKSIKSKIVKGHVKKNHQLESREEQLPKKMQKSP